MKKNYHKKFSPPKTKKILKSKLVLIYSLCNRQGIILRLRNKITYTEWFLIFFFYFIIFIALFLSACSAGSSKIEENKPQNVIFILADDLGWKDLQSYGSDYYETPNIDNLAETGVRFTNAYAANPLCSPTRASILTGQEPGRLRFTMPVGHVEQVVLDPRESFSASLYEKAASPGSRTRLPNEYLTFAEVLREHGYTTAFIGKWHLGRDPYIPENQGFDVVVGGREHPGPPGPGHHFAPWKCDTLPPVRKGTHLSDTLTDEAIKYINKNADNPFLLCLWYYDVHAPLQGKRKLEKKYRKKLVPDTIQRNPSMGAMIENMDWNIGRLMDALKKLNLDNHTIVIFNSDNGGAMLSELNGNGVIATNNYPLRNGKGSNYEGGVRVPLIVKAPGITTTGYISDVVTSTVDHYITILELLDIPFPDGIQTDGVSYLEALKGKTYVRPPIYSSFPYNVTATGNRANISMRHGPWRLYKFYYDGPNSEHRYELYNLDEDIGETNNLAEAMPEKVTEMAGQLDAHAKEAGFLLPQKNVNYTGNVSDAWWGSEDTEISVADKTLKIISIGENPFVETIYTSSVSNTTVLIEFDMKSSSSGYGQISWQLEDEEDYHEKNSVPFTVFHDDIWHPYAIMLPLEGTLSKLRISPSSSPGDIELRNIKLATKDGYFIHDWPMY